ncbi:MAG: SPOR domain-containing protein [Treponema sp.]|jgi:hypothetical protein|nr:SPOR domain-containing protein [Treponema sp.]
MKRVLLALLAGFLFVAPAMAQVSGFSQTGKVTHEMQADGFTMGHPSLPLNSKVMVMNTLTRREIEVTVIRNIKSSPDRIADLSQSAWIVLGLSSTNSEVRIYSKPPEPQSSAAQSANKPVESVPAQTSSQQNLPAQTGSQNSPVQTSPPPAAESSETMARLDRLLDILMAREERDAKERERVQQEKDALEAKQREEEAQRAKEAQLAKEREKAQQEKDALDAQFNKILEALKERDEKDAKEREKAQQEKDALEAKQREEGAQKGIDALLAKEQEKAQQEKDALEAQINKVLEALKERDDKEREKAQQEKDALEARIDKILEALNERNDRDAKESEIAQPAPQPPAAQPVASQPSTAQPDITQPTAVPVDPVLKNPQAQTASQNSPAQASPPPAAESSETLSRLDKLLDILMAREERDAKEREKAQQENNQARPPANDPAPPSASNQARPPANDPAPPLANNQARPPANDPAPPLASNQARPPVYDSMPPSVYDSMPPSVYDSAPPSVYDSMPPSVYDSAPPPVYSPAPPVYNPVQPPDVKIIPSLPDPNNGKIYNLQVGAFSTREAAMDLSIKLRGASFDVSQEFTGALYRVIVKDIPSYMVYYAVQRLSAVGIKEIWIK